MSRIAYVVLFVSKVKTHMVSARFVYETAQLDQATWLLGIPFLSSERIAVVNNSGAFGFLGQ